MAIAPERVNSCILKYGHNIKFSRALSHWTKFGQHRRVSLQNDYSVLIVLLYCTACKANWQLRSGMGWGAWVSIICGVAVSLKEGKILAQKCVRLNTLLCSKAEPAINNVSKFGFPIKFFLGTLETLSVWYYTSPEKPHPLHAGYKKDSWRIKDQLDVTCYFISLLMYSTCFGH